MIQHESSRPGPAPSWPGQPNREPRRWWQTRRGALAVFGVLILVIIVWWASHGTSSDKTVANQPAPVVTAIARQGTFVVYRSEPGTVTPFNSVVVRSRVDGILTRIAFKGGQMVTKGDLLAEIDPRSFQAQQQLATGDLASSQAQLANAQDTLKHYQTLLKQNSISRQRVADQQSLTRQYAAAVKADQGRIGSANLQVSSTRITTPISGMVSLRRVDPGNLVGPSDARGIAVVTQSQPSKVVFAVPVNVAPSVLDQLHGGTCIPVDAYGDGSDNVVGSGHLLAANNEVDPATGTVKFEAQFANAKGTLLPNQFVTVKLPVEVLPQVTLVPAAAIQHGAAGAFVYVIKDDATAEVVPVKVGPDDAMTTVIESGLAPGAKVVIEGADRLRAGTKVKASESSVPSHPSADVVPACHPDDAADGKGAQAHVSASGAGHGRQIARS